MAKFVVRVDHEFIVEADDIRKVLDGMEFAQFPDAVDYEFDSGSITYEEVTV